ncbi:MFS transporter [Actinomyces vulturis]|uniref:MFS transporter n=1 Tax=Actinomyces vulturis TaxID=1857645 RepID=UPI0008301058|nr:MFS transporter [Actinomyces vulturis]
MGSQYRTILSTPGALNFSAAGLVARFPMSMMGISTILAVQHVYGSYSAAGRVSGVAVIATAIGAPLLARRVDRQGQSAVMIPAILISALGLSGAIIATLMKAPEPLLMLFISIAGGFSGSLGSLVRSRWSTVLSKPEHIHTAFSLEAAFDEVAFIIGPVLATALCTAPMLNVTSGWILCLVMQVGGGLWFLGQTKTEPPAHPRATQRRRLGKKTIMRQESPSLTASSQSNDNRSIFRYSAVTSVIVIFMGFGAMFGANDVAVVAFAKELHQPSMAGVVLAAWGFGSLAAALVYGSRSWRWPLGRQFAFAVFVLAIGASFFIVAPTLLWLCVAMTFAGMAIAPMMTCANNIVQVTVPPSRLTEGLTMLGTAGNIGVSMGSIIAGSMVDWNGSFGGFLVVAGCAWMGATICLLTYRFIRTAKTPTATTL